MTRATAACRRRGQPGFGLVEMMVALALGLVVVGAAVMLVVAGRQANTTTNSLSRVQESVRTSHDEMVSELREAGATPCDSQVPVNNVLIGAQGATPQWWATWGEPLHGYAGSAAFPPVADGTAAGTRVAGTQAVVVRYGQAVEGVTVTAHVPATTLFTVNPANHGIAVGDQLLVCNYRSGAIFNVTAVNLTTGTFTHAVGSGNAANCSAGLGVPTVCTATGTSYQFPSGSLVSRFVAAGWYIGNNGRAASGGRSLYRVTRNGADEVAEGVRDMQLTYLVDGGTDYVAAASVADWATVVAARLDLVYEGPDTGAATNAAAARLTRNVGFTVYLRNFQP